MFIFTLLLFTFFLLWLVLYRNKVDPTKTFQARVVTASRGYLKEHLTLYTFYLVYPRFIHSEMMTHKDFSRSAASSRAIPVAKIISQVWNNPAMPIHWGINQPGMQAAKEFDGWKKNFLRNLWQLAGRMVCCIAWVMMKIGVHKQVANRMLEPWQYMHMTMTTCKLANFYTLRIHAAAQPEIRFLAELMSRAVAETSVQILQKDEWHLPWITPSDYGLVDAWVANSRLFTRIDLLKKMSAARCARSSYANFEGERSVDSDLATYSKLVDDQPVHASPCEHQATPDNMVHAMISMQGFERVSKMVWVSPELHGNLTGYICNRNTLPGHYITDRPS